MIERNGNKSRKFLCVALGVVWVFLGAGMASADYIDNLTPSAYWQLEEDGAGATPPTGIYLSDTGVDNAGDCRNEGVCPTRTAADELVGRAQDFGGAGKNGIDIPGSNDEDTLFDWDVTDSFSIEFWMKRGGDASTSVEVMVGRDADGGTASTMHWWVGLSPRVVTNIDTPTRRGGELRFTMRANDGSGSDSLIRGKYVADGQWHHVVAGRDGATNTNFLYLDGKLQGTSQPSYSPNANFKSPVDELNIGWLDDGAGDPGGEYEYAGWLDGVAIYNVALSEHIGVIRQNYLNGLAGYSLAEPFSPAFATTGFDDVAVGFDAGLSIDAAGNGKIQYSANGALPVGMSLDKTTGLINWVPLSTQTQATNSLDITASNGGGSINQVFDIDVVDLCGTALSAYWKLEEDASNSSEFNGYLDNTANTANVGTCGETGKPNCPTISAGDAVSGAAQSFSSGNDGIFVDGDPDGKAVFDWKAGDSFSIELWMKRDSDALDINTDPEVLIGRDAPGNPASSLHWWIGLGPRVLPAPGITPSFGGEVYFVMRAADGSGSDATIKGKYVADGQWHHIVAVRDGVNNQNLLYIDGELQGLTEPTYTADIGFDSPDTLLTIGLLEGTDQYAGLLDEIALYNYALTPTMVEQHANDAGGRGYCNGAPKFDSTSPNPIQVTEGVPFTGGTVTASDPDGDALSFGLQNHPSDMKVVQNGDSADVTWTPAAGTAGTVTADIVAYDDFGGAAVHTLQFQVNAGPGPNAPLITGLKSPVSVEEDGNVTLSTGNFTITYPGGTPANPELKLTKVGNDYTLNNNTITPNADFNGQIKVKAVVNDGTSDSNEYEATITVTAVNDAPVITSTAPVTFESGAEYRYEPEGTDVDSTTLTWSLTGAPDGMTIDTATGVITWTPANGVTTSGKVTLTLTDDENAADTETFVVTDKAASDGGGGGGGGGCFIDTMIMW